MYETNQLLSFLPDPASAGVFSTCHRWQHSAGHSWEGGPFITCFPPLTWVQFVIIIHLTIICTIMKPVYFDV